MRTYITSNANATFPDAGDCWQLQKTGVESYHYMRFQLQFKRDLCEKEWGGILSGRGPYERGLRVAALAALAAPAALAALAALAAGTFWDNFGRQKQAKTSKIGPKPAKASNTIKCGTDFELKL